MTNFDPFYHFLYYGTVMSGRYAPEYTVLLFKEMSSVFFSSCDTVVNKTFTHATRY
jgi:hypothetical protein